MSKIFISKEHRELAKQPFIRPGAQDFDMGYAVSVWDARERVELERLIEENPGKSVVTGSGLFGYVPHSS
jgi:hypothetical protein